MSDGRPGRRHDLWDEDDDLSDYDEDGDEDSDSDEDADEDGDPEDEEDGEEEDGDEVTDEQIIAARRMLWDTHRILVEHGTATAVAGVVSGAVRPQPDSTLCIVLCGANTALAV